MKHFIFTTLLLSSMIFQQHILSQSPQWEWVRTINGATYCHTVADGFGNVFTTGRFETPTLVLGSFTLTNSGNNDIFLVKHDQSGNVIWASSAGGGDLDYPTSIAVDDGGNIYIAGLFRSSSIQFGSSSMTNSGVVDPFLAKYDPSGNVLWVKQGIGIDDDAALAVSTDLSGNVYIAGEFHSPTITFGSIVLNHTSSADGFVVKYDASGNVIWAKSSAGGGEEQVYNLAVDVQGNVLITGYFNGGSVSFGNITLTKSAGYSDMFLAKYDATGNEMWAKNSLGSHFNAEADGIITDASGNVFVSGPFDGSVVFDNTTLISNGGRDVYLVKFNPAGNLLWAKGFGGIDDEWQEGGKCLAIDPLQNIYMVSKFSSSITLGSITFNSNGLHDFFVTKINTSGNMVWAKQVGGAGEDETYDVSYRPEGVFLSGIVNSPASFDLIAASNGSFVAKLLNCGSTSSSTVTACGEYLWNGVVYTTSGDKTYTTANAAGCDSVATLYLTIVNEPTAPNILCPTNSTQYANASCQYPVTNESLDAISSATCGTPQLKYVLTGATTGSGDSTLSGKTLNKGVTTITWTAVNGSLTSSCSFNVNVVDNKPPEFSPLPKDDTISLRNKSCSTKHKPDKPAISDNCDPLNTIALTWVMSGAITDAGTGYVPNHVFPVGVTTITYTAKDASSNTTTCSFNVIVTNSNCPNSPATIANSNSIKTIESGIIDLEVTINPNPSPNNFNLYVTSKETTNIEIIVVDIAGRVLQRLKASPGQSVKFGQDLRPGVYIVKVKQGHKQRVLKIVKQ